MRLHATDPNYRPAVSNQWNVSLQRQFGNSLTVQAAYVGQHTDHMAAIYNMGQNMLLPDGTSVPGPYLSGNPALKNAGTGQQRLNSSTAIQNYEAYNSPRGSGNEGSGVPVQLYLVEVPDQQPGLLRPVWQCGDRADHGRRGLPVVCVQRRAGLRIL